MIEHSAIFLRSRDTAGLEIRATSKFTAEEVRGLLAEHRGILKPAIDLRLLGCPEFVFERVLESRAARIACGPQRRALVDENDRDFLRRESARKNAAIIAADHQREIAENNRPRTIDPLQEAIRKYEEKNGSQRPH